MVTKETCWLETYTGKKINPFNMRVEDIDMIDIAHSLSLTCRFNGHCSRFYSVAEHSILVFKLVNSLFADYKCYSLYDYSIAALLHDATETYLADVPAPIKPLISGYKDVENKVMDVVFEKFNIGKVDWSIIHRADLLALRIEADKFMFSRGIDWDVNSLPLIDIEITEYKSVESMFLIILRTLLDKRSKL